jgi:hypothetical protein
MKCAIWISFDLGVKGDYEGMYMLLDSLEAKECGDSAAFFNFNYEGDLVSALKGAIDEHVTLDRRSRIYAVFPGEDGKYKGRFLVGRRKRPAWAGYAAQDYQEEDESG